MFTSFNIRSVNTLRVSYELFYLAYYIILARLSLLVYCTYWSNLAIAIHLADPIINVNCLIEIFSFFKVFSEQRKL